MANRIPRGATRVASTSGRVPSGPEADKTATVTMYEGQASLGNASSYLPVDCRWIEVTITGSKARAWVKRYTGRRLALAPVEYDDARKALEAAS